MIKMTMMIKAIKGVANGASGEARAIQAHRRKCRNLYHEREP